MIATVAQPGPKNQRKTLLQRRFKYLMIFLFCALEAWMLSWGLWYFYYFIYEATQYTVVAIFISSIYSQMQDIKILKMNDFSLA